MTTINTSIELADIIKYINRRRVGIERLQKEGKIEAAEFELRELSGIKSMTYVLANPYTPIAEDKEWDEAYDLLKAIIEK